MTQKIEDALLAQEHPQSKETMSSIPRNDKNVNPLRALRIASNASARDMVEVVQNLYPKYDKTLQSKCENSDDYGVRLMDDAMEALREHFAPLVPVEGNKPGKDKHVYTTRVQCRLPEAKASILRKLLLDDGMTVQQWLTSVINDYIKNHS